MNSIKILGSHGAKSDKGGSSSFYLNDKNTIDAGNLLKTLKSRSAEIENIWITHSHLDHISDIAYILDNYYQYRTVPLILRALPDTLASISENLLNDEIWPDFAKIPLYNTQVPSVIYKPIELNIEYVLDEHNTIEAFATDHTVPSCGYIIKNRDRAILMSADTHSLDNVIKSVKNNASIKSMIIECSFPSSMTKLAKISKHLTPALLFEKLKPLSPLGLKLYINHMKPSFSDIIIDEIEQMKGKWDVVILNDGDDITF